jgi:hypothetical protein
MNIVGSIQKETSSTRNGAGWCAVAFILFDVARLGVQLSLGGEFVALAIQIALPTRTGMRRLRRPYEPGLS